MAAARDRNPRRGLGSESAIHLIAISALVTTEVRAVEEPNVGAAGKADLGDVARMLRPKVEIEIFAHRFLVKERSSLVSAPDGLLTL
jgi:hypothetical protein